MDNEKLTYAAKAAIQKNIDTKSMQLLLGICSGLIADKQLNDTEIHYLRSWLRDHETICDKWPASGIHYKIEQILADGIITLEERQQTLELLQEITGNYFSETGAAIPEAPILPTDTDVIIEFINKTFCFTGEFIYGTRAYCERSILKLGATAVDNVSRKLDYLVIGANVSPAWVNETYGRKIEKAIETRTKLGKPFIVSEKQWAEVLVNHPI